MYQPIQLRTKTHSVGNSINRSPLRRGLFLLALACFALAPAAHAVVPAPDGGYPGFNTAEGTNALKNLTTGAANTAAGWYSLFGNTDGSYNTGVGGGALVLNNADSNTAVGAAALVSNDSTGNGLANNNTAVGAAALLLNVDGSENTVVGTGSGQNIILGVNNTYLGNFVGGPVPDESSTIRINDLTGGNAEECFIGGIFNNFQPVGGDVVEVTLDLADDHLGWDVGPNQGFSAPAPRSAPQRRGAPQPAARPQRQAMLNEFLKRQKKVEEQQVSIAELKSTVAQQQKQIETLTTQLREQAETFTAQLKEQANQIQKVSAQLEVSKPAPRTVLNN